MNSTRYRSLEDLRSIVANSISEGVTLEYKSSEVIAKRQSPTICKAVSAFANSAGGQFVLGIGAKDGLTLDGGVSPPSFRDWIYKIINSNVSPPLESFEVFEIVDADRIYYVIDVPRSEKAPHQYDGRYYKRRGTHSEPMEHYEIEDIRNRPKGAGLPLRIEIATRQEIMLLLHLRNDHQTESVTGLKFGLDDNFGLERSGIKSLVDRGLRALRPQTELYFHIDTAHSILSKSKEPEMTVRAEYDFLGRRVQESFHFFLGDFNGSAVIRSDEIDALRRLSDKVESVAGELERIRRDNTSLLKMVDGTGLRLSHRTVSALLSKSVLYNPSEFDWTGYQVLLGCSRSHAHKLMHIFGGWSGVSAKQEYEKLPKKLRKKFESIFAIEFDQV